MAEPTVIAPNAALGWGQSVQAGALFTAADTDGDPFTQYEFWDSGTAGSSGYFSLSGIRQATQAELPVAAAALANMRFVGGTAAGAETVWVRAFAGGEWSEWVSWQMTTTGNAPVVSASNRGIHSAHSTAVTNLFVATDAEGNGTITQYQFWDEGVASDSGFFAISGVRQDAGGEINVSLAELALTTYVGGTVSGAETVWARANDGTGWGTWLPWVMSTGDTAPVATPTSPNRSVHNGQSIAAATLFTVNDAEGDVIAQYRFWDEGTASSSGYFSLRGVRQVEGTGFDIASADLADLRWVAGTASGSEVVWVRAKEPLGEWVSWIMTSANTLPVATAANAAVNRNQALAASSLFNVSDAEGDAITQYRFWDEGTAGSSGYFSLSGVRQVEAAGFNVAAADLANLSWVGGSVAGSEVVWVRAHDGVDFGDWAPWTMTTVNHLPVVTASNAAVNRYEDVLASSLFSVSDAEGDVIARYRFWDEGTAGSSGYFSLNGDRRPEGTGFNVEAADLADLRWVGGSVARSEVVWVRAHDGADFGAWVPWTMSTLNQAPSARAANASVAWGQPVAASTLFSTSDLEGDAIGAYEFWDSGDAATSGYLSVNGVRQAVKTSIPVAAANLGNVAFVGGTFAGTEMIWVRASDGTAFGDWVSWLMTTTGSAPVVSASNGSVGTERSVPASSLFSVIDADGDAITKYEFWDDGAAPTSGHFVVGGVVKDAGREIPVDAASLATVTYVGGENPGTETVWVRAHDGSGFGPWQSWNMSSTIRFDEVVGNSGPNSYGVPLGTEKIYLGLGGNDYFAATSGDEVMLMGGTGSDSYVTGSITDAFVIVYENGGSVNDFITPGLVLGLPASPEPILATIDSRHLLLGDASLNRLILVIDWQQPANQIETWVLGGDPEIVGSGSFNYLSFAQFVASLNPPNITLADLVEADPVGLAGFNSSVFDEMLGFYANRENALASTGS